MGSSIRIEVQGAILPPTANRQLCDPVQFIFFRDHKADLTITRSIILNVGRRPPRNSGHPVFANPFAQLAIDGTTGDCASAMWAKANGTMVDMPTGSQHPPARQIAAVAR